MVYFKIVPCTNLGNWMFQYALALSLQDKIGVVIENDTLREKYVRQLSEEGFAEIFKGVKLVDRIPDGARVYRPAHFNYKPVPDTLRQGDWVVDGFFQSEKYFDREKVRAAFVISAARHNYLMEKYGEWLERPNVTGISVRYGKDYRQQCIMHPFVGKRYFRNAIRALSDCQDFVVCSDNLVWCKDWFPKAFPDRNFLFVEGEGVLNQLYIHTLCKNNIVSNSSFSWWGAWLNEHKAKKVFAPSEWFGILARNRGMDWSDLYFDGMTIVSNPPACFDAQVARVKFQWLLFKMNCVSLKRRIMR